MAVWLPANESWYAPGTAVVWPLTTRPYIVAEPEVDPRRATVTSTSTGVFTPKNELPQTVVCAAFWNSWKKSGSSPAPSCMRRGFELPPPCAPSPMLKQTVAKRVVFALFEHV